MSVLFVGCSALNVLNVQPEMRTTRGHNDEQKPIIRWVVYAI